MRTLIDPPIHGRAAAHPKLEVMESDSVQLGIRQEEGIEFVSFVVATNAGIKVVHACWVLSRNPFRQLEHVGTHAERMNE